MSQKPTMSQQQADKIEQELKDYNLADKAMDLAITFESRKNDGYLVPWNTAIELTEKRKAMEVMKTLSAEQKLYAVGAAVSENRRSLSSTLALCAFTFVAGLILPKACSSEPQQAGLEKAPTAKVQGYIPR